MCNKEIENAPKNAPVDTIPTEPIKPTVEPTPPTKPAQTDEPPHAVPANAGLTTDAEETKARAW
jgi:hypothetical protein